MNDLESIKCSNGIESAIYAGVRIAESGVTEISGIPALVLPKDHHAHIFEHLLPHPTRTKQCVSVTTAASFIEYFNRFADDNSVIFCDLDAAKFVGVIDYHSEERAAWCDHTIDFACKKTKERCAWERRSGEKMGQTQFALFIEENLEEIIHPIGAEMLEIATSLRAKTQLSFKKAIRLDNGQNELQYVEEINGTAGVSGKLRIPETIKLGMRVFDGGVGYEMDARFRYRIHEGQLTMWYDLVRPHKTHDAAVNDIFDLIRQQAKCLTMVHGMTSL